jgi:murein DD-endopeptidase MepM/ murein hydrolase activator NlpD
VDIFARLDEPVLAPVAGTMQAFQAPLGGNCGILTGADGRYYYFAHCSRPMASGKVAKGQTIGNVGQSGNAAGTSPHVHFAIATNAEMFASCNGSGDIQGDNSYWTVQAG